MDQAQRIAEYKEYSPRASRLSEERFLLFLEGVTTIFDGFKALDIEALGIEHNELRVIIGPNGAGKTTLCDVVSGKTRPTTGYVFFDGADITYQTEEEIALRESEENFRRRPFSTASRPTKIWNSPYQVTSICGPTCLEIQRKPSRSTCWRF